VPDVITDYRGHAAGPSADFLEFSHHMALMPRYLVSPCPECPCLDNSDVAAADVDDVQRRGWCLALDL